MKVHLNHLYYFIISLYFQQIIKCLLLLYINLLHDITIGTKKGSRIRIDIIILCFSVLVGKGVNSWK